LEGNKGKKITGEKPKRRRKDEKLPFYNTKKRGEGGKYLAETTGET